MFAANEIWLPPPQCYELFRLCHIDNIDDVVNFAKSRNNKGVTLQFPINYQASDGMVFAYPGNIENFQFDSQNEFCISLNQIS